MIEFSKGKAEDLRADFIQTLEQIDTIPDKIVDGDQKTVNALVAG